MVLPKRGHTTLNNTGAVWAIINNWADSKSKRAGHKNLHSVDGQLVLGKGGDDGDEGSGDGEELHFVAETCGGTERYVKGSVGGEICKGGLGEKRGKGRRQAKRHLTGYGKALRGSRPCHDPRILIHAEFKPPALASSSRQATEEHTPRSSSSRPSSPHAPQWRNPSRSTYVHSYFTNDTISTTILSSYSVPWDCAEQSAPL